MKIRSILFSMLILLVASSVFAQVTGARAGEAVLVAPSYSGDAPSPGPLFGTSSETAVIVHAQHFLPPDNTAAYATVNTGGVRIFQNANTVSTDWWAPVQVPSGALVTRIQMHACDTSATNAIIFGMAKMDAPGSTGSNVTNIGSTGTTATPGCAFFDLPVTTPFTMNNQTAALLVFVDWQGSSFSSSTSLAEVRVYYKLQVSPAPATATFGDVSNASPIYKFVEALAAAGITGGCGNGNYCPNDPVTRGQMAVFISTALGLHWTP